MKDWQRSGCNVSTSGFVGEGYRMASGRRDLYRIKVQMNEIKKKYLILTSARMSFKGL
jgi:hypothetical protein